jgi:hypothetical protein
MSIGNLQTIPLRACEVAFSLGKKPNAESLRKADQMLAASRVRRKEAPKTGEGVS